MTKVERLKTYLKRTQKLLRRWETEVPKKKVMLDMVSCNLNSVIGPAPITLKEFEECGAVGCVAGWAYAFAKEDKVRLVTDDRMDAMDTYYGTEMNGCRAPLLFSTRTEPKISEWKEARQRLVARIKQLKTAIKEA